MRAFSFENHTNLKIASGTGHNLIGQLELDAGSYLVWGKLSLGVNVQSGYPPPAYPYTAGMASLALGEADDIAFFGVKPDPGENNATLNLMCAATINRSRRARLYLINLYSVPVYCHAIKVMALQVDSLSEHELGQDRRDAPEDKEERLRDALLKAKISDRSLFTDVIHDG